MFADETEKQLLRDVEDKYDSIVTDRIVFNKRYMSNRAQYYGKHGSVWNTVTNRLELKPERKGKPVRPLNLQGPMVMRFQQKFTGHVPTFRCIPATRDQEDIDGAAVAHDVLLADMRYLDLFGSKGSKLALMTVIDADCYLKTYWNPNAGQYYQFGAEAGSHGGDIEACIRSADMMGIDPDATELEEAAWMMEFPVRHVRYVENHYGIKVPGGDIGILGTYQMRTRAYFDYKQAIKDPSVNKSDYTVVKEYYEAPCRKYPNGRIITIASGRVLDYKENPYVRSDGKPFYPYVQFKAFPAPGRLQSISPIQWTQPAQEGYNASHAQIEEYHRRAVPKVLVPEGSEITRKGMDNVPFEIIPYAPGEGAPQFVPPQPLPNEYYRYVDSWRQNHRALSGMSEATEGSNLSNVRSADHWMAIAEQEAENFGPMIRASEDSWEKVARNIISIEQRFRVMEQMIRITGKYSAHKIRSFTRAELNGRYDVVIVRDPLPLSPMMRHRIAMMYYQMGAWGPPGSAEANLRLAESSGSGSAYLDPMTVEQGARDTALHENTIMDEGQAPKPPHPVENHAVHKHYHVQRMNQPDFKYLPNTSQIAYFEHLLLTDMAAQQAMNPMAMAQQAAATANSPAPFGEQSPPQMGQPTPQQAPMMSPAPMMDQPEQQMELPLQ